MPRSSVPIRSATTPCFGHRTPSLPKRRKAAKSMQCDGNREQPALGRKQVTSARTAANSTMRMPCHVGAVVQISALRHPLHPLSRCRYRHRTNCPHRSRIRVAGPSCSRGLCWLSSLCCLGSTFGCGEACVQAGLRVGCSGGTRRPRAISDSIDCPGFNFERGGCIESGDRIVLRVVDDLDPVACADSIPNVVLRNR